MAITAEVLVIGAGVVGAATAYELAKRGVDVAVVDVGADVGNGCSYANAGLLASSHVEPLTTPANVRMGLRYLGRRDSPFHVSPSPRIVPWLTRFALASTGQRARELTASMQALARQSVALHRDYAEAGLATGFRQSGSMDVFLTEEKLAASGAETLTAAEARAIEPGLGDIAGAILHPDDATCETQAFARACLHAAQELGARVHWNTTVEALTGDATGARTSIGDISCDAVVVCAGLASDALTAPLGLRLPLLGGKGYVLDVPPQSTPSVPLTFKELKVVATPYDDRLRLCGTMDLGDTSDRVVPSRVEAIRRAARRGLPALDTSSPLQVWAGQRPCTADGIPVIGPSSVAPNLHVAAGHGMWGLVLAPVTGAAVAQAVTGAAMPAEFASYSPDRFTARQPALAG